MNISYVKKLFKSAKIKKKVLDQTQKIFLLEKFSKKKTKNLKKVLDKKTKSDVINLF